MLSRECVDDLDRRIDVTHELGVVVDALKRFVAYLRPNPEKLPDRIWCACALTSRPRTIVTSNGSGDMIVSSIAVIFPSRAFDLMGQLESGHSPVILGPPGARRGVPERLVPSPGAACCAPFPGFATRPAEPPAGARW